VQGKAVEKDAYRGSIPIEPCLAIALDPAYGVLSHADTIRHVRKHRFGLGGIDKDVHVQVTGATRLLSAIGKGNRAAKCMGDTRFRERVVNGEELVDQLAHPAVVPCAIRSCRFG
jgi:hypothetical protein